MKVCLVNKFHYRKGGSETYYFTLAEALQAHHHEVIFFSMKDEKNLPCEQEKYFVSNASVKGGIKSRWNMVFHIAYSREAYSKMRELLEEEAPDLLLLNLVHKQITLSILDAVRDYKVQSGKGVKVFWTMHDLIAVCPAYTMLNGAGKVCEECLKGSFMPCVRNRCIKGSYLMSMLSKYEADYIRKRKWYGEIDLFICPSEFHKRKLESASRTNGMGFSKSNIVVMRNPLSVNAEYELNDADEEYFLYFGRLSREKGIRKLIDVSIKAEIRLLIVGTGEMEEELKDYAEGHDNIEFKGFQTGEALKNYIRRCKCVMLPSECYENGPYSAMEAMALGKPLIVSNMGGLPELVENDENGYVYDDSEKGLENCIKKMGNLPEKEYRRMAQASLDRAKALFNPDRYIHELETYYNDLYEA